MLIMQIIQFVLILQLCSQGLALNIRRFSSTKNFILFQYLPSQSSAQNCKSNEKRWKSTKLNDNNKASNTVSLETNNIWEIPEKADLSITPQSGLSEIFEVMRGTSNSIISNDIFQNQIFTIQNTGKELLQEAGIPRLKDEAWRHTNIRKLFPQPFLKRENLLSSASKELIVENLIQSHLIDSSCKSSYIVFIDGHYYRTVSENSDVKILHNYSQLSESDIDLWTEQITYSPDVKELPRDSFASNLLTYLNMANIEDIAIVDVPTDTILHDAVQVLFVNTVPTTATAPTASYPKLLIRVGDNSQLKLKQSFVSVVAGESCSIIEQVDAEAENSVIDNLVVSNTRILMGKNAKLDHTYTQELSGATRHLEVLSASIMGNSSYDAVVVQSGGLIGRLNAHIDLKEPNANCSLNAVTLAGKGQSLDMHSSIVHDTPSAKSEQNQRNVVGERGEAIFKGRIRIPKHAQLTDSAQLCRSIMLGDRARVIAMPTLEITADNIVCSHGASVADLDENSMFYLSARGVNRKEARKLLLRGFVFDMLLEGIMDKASSERIVRKLEALSPSEEKVPALSGQNFMSI